MRRSLFYLVTMFYVLLVLSCAYLMWRDWPNVLVLGSTRLSFIHLLPFLSLVVSYPSSIQYLVQKGEFNLSLERVGRWKVISYLVWLVLFTLLAYLSKESLIYFISLALLVGVLTSAYQLWEIHQQA